MTNPTNFFGWQMPEPTDLVTDLPADFEVFGQAVDTDFQDLLGGTTGQVLSKTSGTDLDFTWIDNDQGDITGVTAGTGISGGGTSGTVTVTNSMATAIDAKGDLIAGTADDTFSAVSVGANDTVLTADSSTPTGLKWATPSSGGMTLISETVASAISSLSLSSIPGTYKQLLLLWSGIGHSAASNYFSIRLNNDSNAEYRINYNTFTGSYGAVQLGAFTNISDNNNSFPFGINQTSADLQSKAQGSLLIDNYSSATKLKQFICNWAFTNTTTGNRTLSQGIYNSVTAITSIDIVQLGGAGTFSNATNTSIRLYGIS